MLLLLLFCLDVNYGKKKKRKIRTGARMTEWVISTIIFTCWSARDRFVFAFLFSMSHENRGTTIIQYKHLISWQQTGARALATHTHTVRFSFWFFDYFSNLAVFWFGCEFLSLDDGFVIACVWLAVIKAKRKCIFIRTQIIWWCRSGIKLIRVDDVILIFNFFFWFSFIWVHFICCFGGVYEKYRIENVEFGRHGRNTYTKTM